MPQYLISWSHDKVVLRNFEGVITTYQEPKNYENFFGNSNMTENDLLSMLEGAEEYKSIGIEKLLSDLDETFSLVPENNERMERRDNE
jgi:lysine 2,3-aminomutase